MNAAFWGGVTPKKQQIGNGDAGGCSPGFEEWNIVSQQTRGSCCPVRPERVMLCLDPTIIRAHERDPRI
jgi:hypothetical protein